MIDHALALPAALFPVALWGGLNLLLMLVLGLNVTRVRRKTNVGVGSGDSVELLRAIRAHGNNSEYVPGLVVAMALMAWLGYSATVLTGVGVTLLVARLLHVHGITQLEPAVPPTRVVGNLLTWALYLGCTGALIATGAGL